MKSMLFLGILTLAILASCQTPQPPSVSAAPNAEISDVLVQVKQALADVQTQLANGDLPPLKSVKLSLKTSLERKAQGSLKLLVITVGGSWDKSKVQQVELTLVPPKPGNGQNISTESLTQALEQAIVSAAQGVKAASGSPIPLNLDSLTVTLEFTVKWDGSAGAKPEIGPVEVGASIDVSRIAVHTLTVTFEVPKKS